MPQNHITCPECKATIPNVSKYCMECGVALSEFEYSVENLAEALHEEICKADHNERCRWYWEAEGRKVSNREDKWSKPEHRYYLAKAKYLIKETGSIEAAFRWFEIFRGMDSIKKETMKYSMF